MILFFIILLIYNTIFAFEIMFEFFDKKLNIQGTEKNISLILVCPFWVGYIAIGTNLGGVLTWVEFAQQSLNYDFLYWVAQLLTLYGYFWIVVSCLIIVLSIQLYGWKSCSWLIHMKYFILSLLWGPVILLFFWKTRYKRL